MTIYAFLKKLPVLLILGLLLLLTACSSLTPISQLKPASTVQVKSSFQQQLTPVSTETAYTCGSWSSNNAPGAYSTIVIYARLMHDAHPISGATASGVVHFHTFDLPFDTHPVSDSGGYVSFTLPLRGQEPHMIPGTVDVSFTINKQTIQCSSAFFTPQ